GNQAPAAGPSATFLVNHAPVAVMDVIQRLPLEGTEVNVATLLANDSDEDGETLTITEVSSPTPHGATVTLVGDLITYTPPSGFTGFDSFTYTVTDTHGATATATVHVTTPMTTIENLGGGHFRITFYGLPDNLYTIQSTDTLNPPVWTTLGTVSGDAMGVYTFEDVPGTTARVYPWVGTV